MSRIRDRIANLLSSSTRNMNKVKREPFLVFPSNETEKNESPSSVGTIFTDSDDYHKYLPYMGKGSRYRRRLIAHNLEKFKLPNLKRMQVSSPVFDEEYARELWSKERTEVSDTERNHLFKKVLQTLVPLVPSDGETSIHTPDYKSYKLSLQEIPPIPSPLTNESFEKYIHLLTHTNFLFKSSSSINGLIPKLLSDFFSLDNTETKNLRSVNGYNNLIYFFGVQKNDLMLAKEYFLQMTLDNIDPNLESFNLMIDTLKKHSRVRHRVDTYKILLQFLKMMKQHELRLDSHSWEAIYNLINNDMHKDVFIGFIKKLNIPLSPGLRYNIFRDLCAQFENTAEDLIPYLDNEIKIDWRSKTADTNLVIEHYLKTENPERAYEILLSIDNRKVRSSTLLLFYKHFAQIARRDLILAFHFTVQQKFKFHMRNILAYHYIMKGLIKSGYFITNNSLIRIMLNEMKQKLNISDAKIIFKTSNFWMVKQISRNILLHESDPQKFSKLEFSTPLTAEENQFYQNLLDKFWWKDKIITRCFEFGDSDYIEMNVKIGMPGKRLKTNQKSQIISTEKLNDIRNIRKGFALRSTYQDRIKVLKYGPREALNNELISRGIVIKLGDIDDKH